MKFAKVISNLLPPLYAAASSDGDWETFLSMLSEATRSPKCHITYSNSNRQIDRFSPENGTRQWIKSVGLSDELLADAAKYGQADEWLRACIYGPYAEGWVGRGAELWPVEKMVRSELYRTILLKHDFVRPIAAILLKNTGEIAFCGLARGKDDPDYGDDVIELLKELTPHMRTAIRFYNKVGELEQNLDSLELALEQFAVGVLVVDSTSTIIFENSIARNLLTSREGLMSEGGKLKATSSRDFEQLQTCIERAIKISERGSDADCQAIGVASIGNKNGRALHAFVAPWLSGLQLALNKPAAVLLVTRPEQRLLRDVWLQTLYGLTKAESKLAILIANGMDGPEAAKHLGLSAATVRTRLKTVFRKTNTRRQSDLARLLATLPKG